MKPKNRRLKRTQQNTWCGVAISATVFSLSPIIASAAPTLVEAENMRRLGYSINNVSSASGQRITRLTGSSGTLSYTYTGEPIVANLAVTYYDETDGACPYDLKVNGRRVARWVADQRLEDAGLGYGNRVTANTPSISLRSGDIITITVNRSGSEFGRVDTLAIEPTIEAETMQRSGYRVRSRVGIASSDESVTVSGTIGNISTRFTGEEGYYSIKTHYIDENLGESPFQLFVDGSEVSSWVADAESGSQHVRGFVVTSEVTDWVYLKTNSEIKIQGSRNGHDYAQIDRIEIAPTQHHVDTIRASKFLSQASMGGTRREIYALARRMSEIGHIEACEEWIDHQFALPRGTSLKEDALTHQSWAGIEPLASVNIHNFEYAWWTQVVRSEEQLRHRTAFALSQIFVTSSAFWGNSERSNLWFSYTSYYDKLLDNAFGNHRDLLQRITYDPFMGVWLTYAHNSKGDPSADIFPDENYAREVMQLFSCGVYSLKPDGEYNVDSDGNIIENYDNDDIREFAKVFTGLTLTTSNNRKQNFFSPRIVNGDAFLHEMQMTAEQHDVSTKRLLNGVILRAGQGGNQDIARALDNLANHDSTAPFLGRELIKRLTTSNPSSAYVNRVTQAWLGRGTYGNGQRGNFKSVIKAILLDDEVRNNLVFSGSHNAANLRFDNMTVTVNDELSGRIHEPILKWTRLYRYFEPTANGDSPLLLFPVRTKRASSDITPDFGQVPMRAPSVFNFYDTEHSPGNGPIQVAKAAYRTEFVSPETETLSDHVVHDFEECLNYFLQGFTIAPEHTRNSDDPAYRVNFSYFQRQVDSGISNDRFVHNLNRDLCAGQMSPEVLNRLLSGVLRGAGRKQTQMARAVALIFSGADYSVSH